jgi:hypothetical protein
LHAHYKEAHPDATVTPMLKDIMAIVLAEVQKSRDQNATQESKERLETVLRPLKFHLGVQSVLFKVFNGIVNECINANR